MNVEVRRALSAVGRVTLQVSRTFVCICVCVCVRAGAYVLSPDKMLEIVAPDLKGCEVCLCVFVPVFQSQLSRHCRLRKLVSPRWLSFCAIDFCAGWAGLSRAGCFTSLVAGALLRCRC